MRRSRHTGLGLAIFLAVILASCTGTGQPRPSATAVSEEARVRTAAAQTVAALGTRIASGENPTLSAATFTLTPRPSLTQWPSPTPPSTLPNVPAGTPEPGNATGTPRPEGSLTATSDAPCNQASFVDDLTIPDDSALPPNTVFTKTWEIKNTGSCTWDEGYALVFAGVGSAMSGPAATPLAAGTQVKPGDTARLSVNLRSPADYGTYEGYWMLRSADDKTFGTGQNGGAPFFVKIRVGEGYNFAEHWCSARWASGAGDLPCSKDQDEARGTVAQQSNPVMEDNSEREGPGLLVAPQPVPGGYIVGHYPPVMVPSEADFRSTISCQPGAVGCYVRFRVAYRVDGGDEQTLGEWNEGSEGGITEAVRDLDMLAGRSVAFSLYVYVNGTPNQSRGIWFNPRITK